jgi:outer membrane lipoprotein-sorting protein
MKSKIFPALFLALALTATAILPARAIDHLATPSAADIVKQSLEKYASLTSYSDEGATISTLGTTIAKSYIFTLKLARTNLYQVVWRQAGEISGAAWSAGSGDFLWPGTGSELRKCKDRETALASATGISGGVAANLPGTFFNMNWGGLLRAYQTAFARAPDDKVGEVDCFVLTHEAEGHANTVWIGKADFLIHQIETDTSGKAVRAALEAQAKKNPQIRAMLDSADPQVSQDVKTIETHRNIVINPPLLPANLDFQLPATEKL